MRQNEVLCCNWLKLLSYFVIDVMLLAQVIMCYAMTCVFELDSISIAGKPDMQSRLDSAIQEVNDKYILLEEQEKNALRTALVEERGRFCLFISCLKPFVV